MLNIVIKTKGKGTWMADMLLFYILQKGLLKDWHSLPSDTKDVSALKFCLSAILILLNADRKCMDLAWFAVKIGALLWIWNKEHTDTCETHMLQRIYVFVENSFWFSKRFYQI
jgi:hypothetical protein